MKRTIAILLSAVLLVGLLTACSDTTAYDDRYGNVSGTPNGDVNGYNRGRYNNDGMFRSDSNTNRGSSYADRYDSGFMPYGNGNYDAGNGTNADGNTAGNGTGMAGSR